MAATVYLVDADPAVRDSLTTLMDLNGFTVRSFSTGAAFFRSLGADAPLDVRCVICEAELPDTTGIQLYRRLLEQKLEPPFALLVSRRSSTTLRSAQRAGIKQIFQKPLVHRHLGDNVRGSTEAVNSKVLRIAAHG